MTHLTWQEKGGGVGSVFTDEVGKLSWVMQVSPKCSHMYPCKREEDFIGKEDVEVEPGES